MVKKYILIHAVTMFLGVAVAQQPAKERILDKIIVGDAPSWWNSNTMLNTYRLPPPPKGAEIVYIDITADGKPNLLRTTLPDGTPVQWVDDDGNMEIGQWSGDTVNDCVMIDRNKDGVYGGYGDLIIDWIDSDSDGIADMQVVVENIDYNSRLTSGGGHYMWVIDSDKDNIFNYIDWNTYELRCWLHSGLASFYTDYHGNSTFLKVHSTPERLNDVRLSWENPFLFYDYDADGLTEMSVRLCDSRHKSIYNDDGSTRFSAEIDWAAISIDLDNDNSAENPFDLDMTINFMGEGTNYINYSRKYSNMRGLPQADYLFLDPKWRQNNELIFPDRELAFDFIYNKGVWDKVWFVFDEDGDCKRWERVELYQPLDLYKTGAKKGGLDDNRQSDVIGDRGEWDNDNSGNGALYVADFDGKIHLYGAEWGAWRIDQRAEYYQGMGGIFDIYGPGRQQRTPSKFPVIKYEDTDGNGFFDKILFDIDADHIFEQVVTLAQVGLDDKCKIYQTSQMTYEDYVALFRDVSDRMWSKALLAIDVAHCYGLNTSWYAHLKSPKSARERYDFGFWLQLYIYKDLEDFAIRKADSTLSKEVNIAYFSGRWDTILKSTRK